MWSVRLKLLRGKLQSMGMLPTTRLARFTLYLIGFDLVLILLDAIVRKTQGSSTTGLSGWISFLGFAIGLLLALLALRWIRKKLLWRLRNRLIVTYVFIGVIPVVLLILMALIVTYLFVGQFATYVVNSDLQSELRSLRAVNSRLASEMATALRRGRGISSDMLQAGSGQGEDFRRGELTAWFKGKPYVMSPWAEKPADTASQPLRLPTSNSGGNDASLALDGTTLVLRAVRTIAIGPENLVVISSVPLDRELVSKVAEQIGMVSFTPFVSAAPTTGENPRAGGTQLRIGSSDEVLDFRAGNRSPGAVESSANLPQPVSRLDREVSFPSELRVTDWNTGARRSVLVLVTTRPSLLYRRLFRTVGDFVNVVLIALTSIAVVFGIIELIALIIGVRLTRTITRSVAQLYEATQRVNRGDLSYRIAVKSNDQLAALETSFNSMSGSLQRLIAEQKEKQRLESELAIAQEVQAQLFPKQAASLKSFEVHGVCRPARTVSGDYYDFVPLGPNRLGLAVGDISGKGISAALLMATIHSAVRAYTLERVPSIAAATVGSGIRVFSTYDSGAFNPESADISPASLCHMLNLQLFESTPAEKYATLFISIYDGDSRRLSYCNAGHLPPLILGADGAVRRLERGGTVIGLISGVSFEQAHVELRPGDLFLAYSDGVTEPENEFGEFGEQRLIGLVRENFDLPLARISDQVLAAVQDWIGANEQPDDVTLVLAKVR